MKHNAYPLPADAADFIIEVSHVAWLRVVRCLALSRHAPSARGLSGAAAALPGELLLQLLQAECSQCQSIDL
jgi:hypothetical protein